MFAESEAWLAVPGYEGLYEVSDLGRVRSLDKSFTRKDGKPYTRKGQLRTPVADGAGYAQVQLLRTGKATNYSVHRLVLRAFVGEPPTGLEGCHNDGDRTNNRLSNLRWDTRSANMLDRVKHGTHSQAAQTHCKRGHEFTDSNTHRANGRRRCQTCYRAYHRKAAA